MGIKKRSLFLLTFFIAGLLLMIAPLSSASINTDNPTYDGLMQTELDSLLSQVSGQFAATGNYIEKAEFFSVFEKGLSEQGAIKNAYDLALEAQELANADKENPELQEKARIAMDDLFLVLLNQIMLNKELGTTDQEITQALIDIIEGRGEGFSTEPEPFVLGPLSSREAGPVIPPDEDIDDDIFGFEFYGKTYNLDDPNVIDPAKLTNGVIWFGDTPGTEGFLDNEGGPTSPAIVPLFVDTGGEEHTFEKNVFEAPKVTKNEAFRRFTWSKMHPDMEEEEEMSPVSASLYKNNWIAFAYSDFRQDELVEKMDLVEEEEEPSEGYQGLSVGLVPGSGEKEMHPGQDFPRGTAYRVEPNEDEQPYVDMSQEVGESLENDTEGEYLVIMEDFENPERYDRIKKRIRIEEEEEEEYRERRHPFFDLNDSFIVFRPDAHGEFTTPDQGEGNKYTVETGNPLMIVDRSRHHYDEELSSLDQAIIHIAENKDTLDNDFRPGSYGFDFVPESEDDVRPGEGFEGIDRWTALNDYGNRPNRPYVDPKNTKGTYAYGLQTVGSNGYGYGSYGYDGYGGYNGYGGEQFTPLNTQEKLDESNFLAYVVQVEEDRVNEKLGEMSGHKNWSNLKKGIRSYDAIRERDAFFVKNADAQAGRVMRDIHGNWVRVQQYILRPTDKQVKVLNVSLREAGDQSGMSTIDFTTNFTEAIPTEQDLRSLPWGDYLRTNYKYEYDSDDNWGPTGEKYIHYHSTYVYDGDGQTYGTFAPEIDNMYVKFTNPGNESVQESRSFFAQDPEEMDYSCREQYVKSETLALNNTEATQSFTNTFFADHSTPTYSYISHFGLRDSDDPLVGEGPGYYASNDHLFNEGDTKILDVNIHEVASDYSWVYDETPPDFNEHYEVSAYDFYYGKGTQGGFDIWSVLGANEGTNFWIESGYSWESAVEIVMNKEGFFNKPVDTIYIPMSHMMWVGNDYMNGPT